MSSRQEGSVTCVCARRNTEREAEVKNLSIGIFELVNGPVMCKLDVMVIIQGNSEGVTLIMFIMR